MAPTRITQLTIHSVVQGATAAHFDPKAAVQVLLWSQEGPLCQGHLRGPKGFVRGYVGGISPYRLIHSKDQGHLLLPQEVRVKLRLAVGRAHKGSSESAERS